MTACPRPEERPHEVDQAPSAVGVAASAQRSPAAPEPSAADLEAPPDHPAHVPAGDPGREWRKRRAWLDAAGWSEDDSPKILDRLPMEERLDVWFRLMEWAALSSCPQVRAMASRGVRAGEAMLRCETDASGRTVSLAKLLGLSPEGGGGLSAGQAVARKRRNVLLRQARASRPEWRDASERRAAAMMLTAFRRYCEGGWQADRSRPTAPAGDPARACFWRVLRLGVPVPGTVDGLKLILED